MLFRKQAIENKSTKLTGDIILLPRPSQVFLTIFLIAWVLSIVTWLFLGSYKKSVSVIGWVESSNPATPIYSSMELGLVSTVYVEEGEEVIKGQPLFTLSKSTGLSSERDLESLLIAELQKQYDALHAAYERKLVELPLRAQLIDSQLTGAKTELREITKQVRLFYDREQIAKSEFESYRALRKNDSVSQFEINSVEKELLSIQSEAQEQRQLAAELQGRVDELNSKKILMPSLSKDELSSLERELARNKQQIVRSSAEQKTTLRAMKSGVVSNIQISLGQTLKQSDFALNILPKNTHLKLRLLVPARHSGFLQLGQEIHVKYDAFPYQKFGVYSATISTISGTVLLPEEFLRIPIKVQEASYQVEALLDTQYVDVYNRKVRLKPDMTVSARIILDERSLIEWFLEPFINLRGRA